MSGFGVYVHIPFCRHRCDYCAFATWTDKDHVIGSYVDAVIADIRRAVDTGMPPADTVFVGGGTPTRIPPGMLARVLGAIPLVDPASAEVTVECNPDDVTPAMMETYAGAGVNRVSIGVQSMVTEVLASLGRTHTPDNVARAVDHARTAGIAAVNLDLIYGGRGESVGQWERTVVGAIDLDPTHVSAYGLTVEPGTPLAADATRHPDDDDLADKYVVADDLLVAAGYVNYEISNWCRPGHECRHNMIYWTQGDYRGFGCAAHSHEQGRRWWNLRTPERYIEAVAAGLDPIAAEEVLDGPTRARERLELSLRTRTGVPAGSLDVDELGDLVEVRGDSVVLTRRGRLLANEVSLRLKP